VPRGENIYQSIESMNEKAPEEAERRRKRKCPPDGQFFEEGGEKAWSRDGNPLVDVRLTVRRMRRVDWTC
jgi:hypothetical protein